MVLNELADLQCMRTATQDFISTLDCHVKRFHEEITLETIFKKKQVNYQVSWVQILKKTNKLS